MTFSVRWPDGRVEDCYSPSLVVHDHLTPGRTYTVADFAARSDAALQEAGDRVARSYGFACTSAMASRERIERSAAAYDPGAQVEVLRMWPPLPPAEQQEQAS